MMKIKANHIRAVSDYLYWLITDFLIYEGVVDKRDVGNVAKTMCDAFENTAQVVLDQRKLDDAK